MQKTKLTNSPALVAPLIAAQEAPVAQGRAVQKENSVRDWEADRLAKGWRKVATGTWFYDGTVPKPITVWAKPASQSSTRYDDDDQLDENRPVPDTNDGFLYCYSLGHGEFLTIGEAKDHADAQPWGPVRWD